MPKEDPFLFKTRTDENYKYFDVTNQGIVKRLNPNKDRMDFWDRIMTEY